MLTLIQISSQHRLKRAALKFLTVGLGVFSLAGCLTPSSGPDATAVYANASREGNEGAYELLELDENVVDLLKLNISDSLLGHFGNRRPGPGKVTVGAGDLLSVSIYESDSGGLYTPSSTDTLRQGNFITIPQQVVDNDGTISIPYGGKILAKGRSRSEIEREIVDRIKDRAVDPQAVVSIMDSRSSVYSVLGDVKAPGRFPINWTGERILAGLARAGGPNQPDYAESVTLTRDGKTATVSLQTLVKDPKEDIFLRPGDTIFVRHEPRFYTALGATGRSGHYPIDVPKITLAEAVGRAQGLLDIQADPTGVFLMRWERRSLLERIGRDVTAYHSDQIPTIYHIDWRNPKHMLASQQIDVRHNDIVYVTNAPTVEINKALLTVQNASAIAANGSLSAFYLRAAFP